MKLALFGERTSYEPRKEETRNGFGLPMLDAKHTSLFVARTGPPRRAEPAAGLCNVKPTCHAGVVLRCPIFKPTTG